MRWQIIVDRSLCDGNGLCVEAAPEHFALDQDYQLQLLRQTCDDHQLPGVERAVNLCPKAALRIGAADA